MFLFLFVFACCTPRGKDERTPATRDILCKVDARTGATPAMAKSHAIIRTNAVVAANAVPNARMGATAAMAVYIATRRTGAVHAPNAVPAAERIVCRMMRLGAVFEHANPFTYVKSSSASRF